MECCYGWCHGTFGRAKEAKHEADSDDSGDVLGVGYTRDRAGLPLEGVRARVPQSAADQVLIRVAASSLNPLEYKLADLNFMGRTPPVVLGLDLSGVVVAAGHHVQGVAVGDAVAAMADLNGDGGGVATGGSGGEGGYAVA